MTPAAAISLYGKLPSRGDFIRGGPQGQPIAALDGWLQRGLLTYRPVPGAVPPTLGFVFRYGDPRRALVGALRMSRDRAGRVYPFVLATDVPTEAGAATVRLSATLGPFLRAAALCVEDVVEERLDLAEAPARVSAAAEDISAYADFLRQTAAEAFAGGASAGGPHAPALLAKLAEALRPYAGRDPIIRFGLRLPLPDVPASRPLAVAFWLDAAARMLGTTPSTATLLWTADGERASAVLFFGTPAPGALPYLLAGADNEAVYDLEASSRMASPAPAPSVLAPAPPTLAALLHRL